MNILKTDEWYLERALFLVAGIVILISLTLAVFLSSYWLIFTALVGLNLLVFALGGYCLTANILRRVFRLSPRLGITQRDEICR